MANALVVNISTGPITVLKYDRIINPGVAAGFIVGDTAAHVITALGGATAIAGVLLVTDVPSGQTADVALATGDTGVAADLAAPAGQAAAGTTGRIADAGHVHPIGTVADAQAGVGLMVVFTRDIADAATADYDIVLTEKVEVLEVIVQKRGSAGGAANTVQLKKGATAVSDAISINIADATAARQTTIDDAQSTYAIGATLRLAVVKAGGNAACHVTVIGVTRA